MNSIIRTVIFISLTALRFHSLAQSDYENHKKYWYYKSRLNNDFIKIGLDSGESIPFNSRGSRDNPPFVDQWGYARELGYGDATTRLGIYLAVLATEYKLLKNSNQDLSKIKHEIFCALFVWNSTMKQQFAKPLLFYFISKQ